MRNTPGRVSGNVEARSIIANKPESGSKETIGVATWRQKSRSQQSTDFSESLLRNWANTKKRKTKSENERDSAIKQQPLHYQE